MFPKGLLTAKLGTDVGRIVPTGTTPADGSYAFVLGSDRGGVIRNLANGDFFEVTQYADLLTDDPTYLRGTFRFRPPTTEMPDGVFWRFTLFIVGSGAEPTARVTYDLTGTNDRTVTRKDFALPLRGVVALARLRIGVRLELVAEDQSGSTASVTDFDSDTQEITIDGLTNQDAGAVGRIITLTGSSANDGNFVISEVVTPTQVKAVNTTGAAPDGNNGAIAWSVDTFRVELPGVYADSWLLDTLEARPTLINRVPEPDETQVPVESSIVIEMNDPNVTGIGGGSFLTSTLVITVNGETAYDGGAGGFQTGFDGPDSAIDNTLDEGSPSRPRTLRVVIDPTDTLPPLVTIPVTVYQAVRGQPFVDFEYSFTTEDLIAPLITSAVSTDRRVVRVTLSEPVISADASESNDALNPGNWTFTVGSTNLADDETGGLPAVTPIVLSVTEITDTVFDLNLDIEITPGALYRVAAGPVEDLFGNAFVAPNNTAFFNGYVCQGPAGRQFRLLRFLPDMNVNEDETQDLAKFIGCFQELTDILLCDVDHWTDILDPDVAPERFVDAMLADLGNPFDFDLGEVDKRRLVRVLVPLYEQKGTDAGIINAIRFFLGLEVTIGVPAFEDIWLLGVDELGISGYLGSSAIHDRLSFVVVSGITLTDDQKDKITKIVEYMKRAECHFLGFVEPEAPPEEPDHWELGLSLLGVETLLH